MGVSRPKWSSRCCWRAACPARAPVTAGPCHARRCRHCDDQGPPTHAPGSSLRRPSRHFADHANNERRSTTVPAATAGAGVSGSVQRLRSPRRPVDAGHAQYQAVDGTTSPQIQVTRPEQGGDGASRFHHPRPKAAFRGRTLPRGHRLARLRRRRPSPVGDPPRIRPRATLPGQTTAGEAAVMHQSA